MRCRFILLGLECRYRLYGIFYVLAFNVASSMAETGIRMALGSSATLARYLPARSSLVAPMRAARR